MTEYRNAKTQFVRDRIKETPFEKRKYIGHLLWLEEIISRGGPHQWAEGMAYGGLIHDYPLEAVAIQKEIRDGEITTTEEFHRLV